MARRHTALAVAALALLLTGAKAPTLPAASIASGTAAPRVATASPREAADTRAAREVLDRLRSEYRYLDGVTVRLGATPNGEQAVAYYTAGRILIDRDHSASIEKILAHEVWHVIDWRDNGRLDWGEAIPPRDPSSYERD